MGITDLIVAAFILAGAAYLLYRSVWKQKGHCHCCSGGECGKK
jgi:hypothetical protein